MYELEGRNDGNQKSKREVEIYKGGTENERHLLLRCF